MFSVTNVLKEHKEGRREGERARATRGEPAGGEAAGRGRGEDGGDREGGAGKRGKPANRDEPTRSEGGRRQHRGQKADLSADRENPRGQEPVPDPAVQGTGRTQSSQGEWLPEMLACRPEPERVRDVRLKGRD
jgi:hypothetical protein